MAVEVRPRPASRAVAVDDDVRRVQPVVWWAISGAVYLAGAAYVLVRWINSGEIQRTPTGPDRPADWVLNVIHTVDIVGPMLALATVYWFVVRPWRRDGRLSPDGLLLIAWLCMYFPHDILLDYTQYWWLSNSYFMNFGSWLSHVPGTITPNAHLIPEPFLTWGCAYAWLIFVPTVAGSWLMGKAKRCWPRFGKVRLFLVVWAAFMVFDLAVELPAVAAKFYAYGGAIRDLSLFPGTTYQFPLYEPVFMGLVWAGGSAFRYFRDDKGRTIAERGVDELQISSGRKTALRLLATIGFLNAMYFATYGLPIQWFAAHADAFPKGLPSYLINGVCGPGTGYDCPGAGVPIPRR